MNTLTCRKSLAELSHAERDLLKDAILQLHEKGIYQRFVSFHAFVGGLGHFGPAFLPWHRKMLLDFERELQRIHPSVNLPYWDFTSANLDNNNNSKIWRDDFLGMDGTVTLAWTRNNTDYSWTIERDSIDPTVTPIDPGGVNDELDEPTYPEFRLELEGGSHGAAHGFLGIPGDQSRFATAVNDPFFFFLHANIDRLWVRWQERRKAAWLLDNPNQAYPSGQLWTDYFWDKLTDDTTWEKVNPGDPADRHNLPDVLWPWDGTKATGDDASQIEPYKSVPETIRNRELIDHRALGYLYDDDQPVVTKLTNSLSFHDMPEGEESARAVVFEVLSCAPVTFEAVSGPTVTTQSPADGSASFGLPLGTVATTSAPDGVGNTRGRVWITYRGTSDGDSVQGTVRIRCQQTGEEWDVPITANTVKRPNVAAVLVMDRSGSMNNDSGDGRTRIQVLREAATVFADVLQDDNGIGLASFDDSATADMAVSVAGGSFGTGRSEAKSMISEFVSTGGDTSIGNGLEKGVQLLDDSTGFDTKALIVLTDGHENEAKYIADVANQIDDRVYAIGLGTAEVIKPAALNALVNQTGGYVDMTGTLSIDDRFRLVKYYLQILAGVTNQDIVVDPDNRAVANQVAREPFTLNETDISTDVILLTPQPDIVRFALETPFGEIIHPYQVDSIPGLTYRQGDAVSFFRATLPLAMPSGETGSGTWHALVWLDAKSLHKARHGALGKKPNVLEEYQTHGIPYSVNVHAYSNLRMRPGIDQDSMEPGATLRLHARLTEYGLPVRPSRATLWAVLTTPSGGKRTMLLLEEEEGVYRADVVTTESGIYHFHLFAAGDTLRGRKFTREQVLTGSVYRGGDAPLHTSDDRTEPSEEWCRKMHCLLSDPSIRRWLERQKIDPDAFTKCVCLDGGRTKLSAEPTFLLAQPAIARLLRNPEVVALLTAMESKS